ncbi:MAG TPA: hypothetical protein VJN88_11630 [Ktedonobacterales bacterium]|nr:hypothetical protein [Ktedonobacterales bacterium]
MDRQQDETGPRDSDPGDGQPITLDQLHELARQFLASGEGLPPAIADALRGLLTPDPTQ